MHDVKQLEIVMRYHEETKHHFNRYARALGYLDWANQPNPFRRYEGATLVRLPILSLDEEPLSPPYEYLYQPGALPSAPVTIRILSRFFEYALALSAWKQAGGTRWASAYSKKRERDRKSTRLNSSHVKISYAVFCLKKKKKNNNI